MIVELIGCTGAGKTTLAGLLRDHADTPAPIVLAADLITEGPGRRWIRDPTAINVVADVTVFPSFLRGWHRNREFVRFAFERLRHAPSWFSRWNYMREVVRDVGKHELARRAGQSATVVVDEGALLTAAHLFVYSDAAFDDADLGRFARVVPVPDRVVYVTAPLDVLVDRAWRRSDRRRELVSSDRAGVERWIGRAVEVFDGLIATPEIRDRVLVVDNADGSPAGRRAAVSRIAAFIDDRGTPEGAVESSAASRTPDTVPRP